MLAGSHYQEHSPFMADYCRVLAHRIVRDMRHKTKWLPVLKSLMEYSMNPYQDLQPFWNTAQDPSGLAFLHKELQGAYTAALVNIGAAFSLLFT